MVITMRKFGWVMAALGALTLSACGGGSLSSGTSTTSTTSSSSGSSGSSTSSGGTPATTYAAGNGSGSSFQSGVIGIANATLSAGGTDSLTVSIVDQTGTLYTASSVTIAFSSACLSQGLATLTPTGATTAGQGTDTVVTTTGTAEATYTAAGCSGPDSLTANATVAGQSLTATGTITVAPATIGSIQFVSATPTSIGLKGTGLNETSTVVFKVLDSTGNPRPGVSVAFTLNTSVGGITLLPATATTANDGTVQTVVSSGTQHTAVRVTATITSPALSTQSSQLTVTTGLPASAGFSIAFGQSSLQASGFTLACPNVEAYGIDGVTVPITVRLADRYNNPAPNGTSVAFTTDGGHVDGSCTTPSNPAANPPVQDGTCTVTWTSANPRPQTSEDSPALLAAGRAAILGTAIGEESFTDINGSGFYVQGDPFQDLGEPYRDDNENGQYDSGEYFLDFNNNGMRDPPDGVFKGITCSDSSCSTTTLAIGAQTLLVMSTSGANIQVTGVGGNFSTSGGGLTIPQATSGSITYNVQDLNTNPMAAGTSIAVTADTAIGSIAASTAGFTVGCTTTVGGTTLTADFNAVSLSGGATSASGNISITVTSPSKTTTTLIIPVQVN
jgi:hypothetical protein